MSVFDKLKSFFGDAFVDPNEADSSGSIFARDFSDRQRVTLEKDHAGEILGFLSWSGLAGDNRNWMHPLRASTDYIAAQSNDCVVIPFVVCVGRKPGKLSISNGWESVGCFATKPRWLRGRSIPAVVGASGAIKCAADEIVYGFIAYKKRGAAVVSVQLNFSYEIEVGYKGATREVTAYCSARIEEKDGVYRLVPQKA